jgi:hypothetical protein
VHQGFYNLIRKSHHEFLHDKGITATLKRRSGTGERPTPDYFKPHDETADHATVMPEWVNDELDGGTHLTCNLSFNVSGRVEFIGADSNKSSEEITVKDYEDIRNVVQYVYVWLTAVYNFATAECSTS